MATVAQLRKIMPRLSLVKAVLWAPRLNAAMARFDITTPLREAAFLAQLAHESGELRYTEEIWGPSPAQRRYEGRVDLGNVQQDDGYRYRGRGPIQITGRANYAAAGKALSLPLLVYPDLAKQVGVGSLVAAWFWASRGLNLKADARDFVGITRAINGGTNGLQQREAYHERAKLVLGAR